MYVNSFFSIPWNFIDFIIFIGDNFHQIIIILVY